MLASYLLARTLVPTLASIILPAELRAERARALDLSIRATAGETPFAYMYPGSNGFGTWD